MVGRQGLVKGGMRRWKNGGKVGMELVRDGWEPLFLYLLLLLHPAVCRCRGTLRCIKGNTARSKAKVG